MIYVHYTIRTSVLFAVCTIWAFLPEPYWCGRDTRAMQMDGKKQSGHIVLSVTLCHTCVGILPRGRITGASSPGASLAWTRCADRRHGGRASGLHHVIYTQFHTRSSRMIDKRKDVKELVTPALAFTTWIYSVPLVRVVAVCGGVPRLTWPERLRTATQHSKQAPSEGKNDDGKHPRSPLPLPPPSPSPPKTQNGTEPPVPRAKKITGWSVTQKGTEPPL